MTYAARPMGDYKTYGYSGDPGFLSSLWKGFKKVAKFIPGPIGTIARVAGVATIAGAGAKILTPPIQGKMTPPAFGYPSFPAVGTSPYPGGGPWTAQQMRSGSQQMLASPSYGAMVGPQGGCPTGYHYAKDGSGRLVRNRRMNIANPRALRRAMRRVQGFEKMAKRTIQFTRRVKMKKRGS